MSLASRLATAPPLSTRKGPDCDVQQALTQLDQEDADALVDLIFKRLDLSASVVSEFVLEDGIQISHNTIARHRRAECMTCRRNGR